MHSLMLLQVPSFQCRFLSSPSLRYGPFLLQELTTSAGEDALEAMNTFVQRLLGVPDPTQLKVCLSSFYLCSIYGTWDWSSWAHPEKKSSFSQGSLSTWLCKHPVLSFTMLKSFVGGLQRAATETTAAELAKLLYWLMVVGYSIRNIEVRYDMERVLGMPPKLAELPPGEDI